MFNKLKAFEMFKYDLRRVLLAALLTGLCHQSAVAAEASHVAVGPQYDTTHVYVAPDDFDKLVSSLISTFGGTATKQGVFTVTPTASKTKSQLVLTPDGSVSVFGFETPVPYPFGQERTGYLVQDLDAAIQLAQDAGAAVVVAPFPDPIGRDVVIQWPGGVYMQLYWHTVAPAYPALARIPENRVYVAPGSASGFVADFIRFAHGKVLADERRAPGVEVGRPDVAYRSIQLESAFGKVTVLVTDGHLPYPYGRETTGYAVDDLPATLEKAKASGAIVLVQPYASRGRQSAMVQFPGGYVAELHAAAGQ
jgi:predicted enzyme related to lactoylglutathione lyase